MSTTYTFEELAAAAAGSNSIGDAVRMLGREPSPGRNRYVMGLMREIGIDCRHFRNASQLYTREMLEEAAAASKSISEVVRRLGAKEVGGTQAYIGRQLRRYGIDVSHFDAWKRGRTIAVFDRESLIAAAQGATSVVEVVQRLGAGPGAAQYERVRRSLIDEGIDVTRRDKRRLKDIPKDEFAEIVARSRSIAECAKLLDVRDCGAFRNRFHRLIAEYELDLSHMSGQAHARGTRSPQRTSPAEILIANPGARRRINSRKLRAAMLEIGAPYRCGMCGTGPVWQDREITLEVDHISGDFTDNRPQNLRFLCPNCHATTPTFCRKKKQEPYPLDC